MSSQKPRMEYARYGEVAGRAAKAVLALSEAAVEAGLDRGLLEILKLRVSQINGCAFCVQYHLTVARKLAVPATKLDLVVVWREVQVFSERERAALQWAEALTMIASRHPTDAEFEEVRAAFDDAELANLTAAIGAINVWNRIAVGFAFTPQVPEAALSEAA